MVEGGSAASAARSATAPGLRVVFLGTPQFAVPTLRALVDSRHTVCGVVTQPDRPRGRGQKISNAPVKILALERQLPIFQPERLRDPRVAEALRGWSPDIGVVAAYGKLIPEDLLAVPRLGMINVHASLLPRLRGAAPVHRAVIDGALQTGITIMRVEKNLDAGGMFARVRRPIGPDETSDVVERDLASMGAALLVDVIEQIAAGTAVEEPQDYMFATYAPRLTKEEGLLDWSLPASFVHNRVRGLHPWPHAHTFLDGKRLILLKTRVVPSPADPAIEAGEKAGPTPGTVLTADNGGIQVATGHGGRVEILELQAEGRRPMQVREFLAGHHVAPGTILGGRGDVPGPERRSGEPIRRGGSGNREGG
ncbi:MAG: methionyl-tRNA formyltransferase [Vicinamibacterales bacterium]